MATTITAASIAPVLHAAADRVAGLGYTRVNRLDVHRALWQSADQYDIADAALQMLAAHVPDADWLNTTSRPHSRDEVAAQMHAAADASAWAEVGDWLASADQGFDWTRRFAPDVRSLLTTALEIGPRAARFLRPVVPVQAPRGEH